MFTDEEMRIIRQAEDDRLSYDALADKLGMHRTSLERKLLRHHQMAIVPIRTFKLVPLKDLATEKSKAPETAPTV